MPQLIQIFSNLNFNSITFMQGINYNFLRMLSCIIVLGCKEQYEKYFSNDWLCENE